MLIEESFVVEAPSPDVARFLLDIPRMAVCVPGVQNVRRVEDNRYEAVLLVRLGPIRAEFSGEVELDSARAPGTIAASASGTDRTTGSVVQIGFTADLADMDNGWTEVRTASDVTIRGRLGQFGIGVISTTSREMVKAFARCASQSVGRENAMSLASGDPVPLEPARPAGIVSIIGRGLLAWLVGLRNRLFSRDADQRESP